MTRPRDCLITQHNATSLSWGTLLVVPFTAFRPCVTAISNDMYIIGLNVYWATAEARFLVAIFFCGRNNEAQQGVRRNPTKNPTKSPGGPLAGPRFSPGTPPNFFGKRTTFFWLWDASWAYPTTREPHDEAHEGYRRTPCWIFFQRRNPTKF